MRTGYVQFMSNNSKGNAKFAFVGTNNEGYITTFHTESGKCWRKVVPTLLMPKEDHATTLSSCVDCVELQKQLGVINLTGGVHS